MKWFNSDLTNKGMGSELVKGLLMDNARKAQEESKGEEESSVAESRVQPNKVKSENELLALCYLIYLETNNYLTTAQKYLFGDLV